MFFNQLPVLTSRSCCFFKNTLQTRSITSGGCTTDGIKNSPGCLGVSGELSSRHLDMKLIPIVEVKAGVWDFNI